MENQENYLNTKNMFIESCKELGISFAKDLNKKIILEAYENFINQHFESIQKKVSINLNLNAKYQAKEYLLSCIKHSR